MTPGGLKRILLLCLLSLGMLSFGIDAVYAETEAEQVQPQETTSFEEGTVLQPREPSSKTFDREGPGNGLVWAIYLFLLMVAALIGLWLYSRKGGLTLKKSGFSNELKIRETKALGNRQFLVVVEYGEQKMLIGVAPGVINHLCYLEDAQPEEPTSPQS